MSAPEETPQQLEQRLRRNVQSLVSPLDTGKPVGVDVGVVLPLVRLLEAGLPGCTRWTVDVLAQGLRATLWRDVPQLGEGWNAQKIWTWEQLRLYVGGADPLLRHTVAEMLRQMEQAHAQHVEALKTAGARVPEDN